MDRIRDFLVGAVVAFFVLIGFGGLATEEKPPAPASLAHPEVATRVCEASTGIVNGVGETTSVMVIGGTQGVVVDGDAYWLNWQANALVGDPVSVERPYFKGDGAVQWAEQISQDFAACVRTKPVDIKVIPHTR